MPHSTPAEKMLGFRLFNAVLLKDCHFSPKRLLPGVFSAAMRCELERGSGRRTASAEARQRKKIRLHVLIVWTKGDFNVAE